MERERTQKIFTARIRLIITERFQQNAPHIKTTKEAKNATTPMYSMYRKKKSTLKISMESLEKFGLRLSKRQISDSEISH